MTPLQLAGQEQSHPERQPLGEPNLLAQSQVQLASVRVKTVDFHALWSILSLATNSVSRASPPF